MEDREESLKCPGNIAPPSPSQAGVLPMRQDWGEKGEGLVSDQWVFYSMIFHRLHSGWAVTMNSVKSPRSCEILDNIPMSLGSEYWTDKYSEYEMAGIYDRPEEWFSSLKDSIAVTVCLRSMSLRLFNLSMSRKWIKRPPACYQRDIGSNCVSSELCSCLLRCSSLKPENLA